MKLRKATAGLVSIIAIMASMPVMAQTSNSNSDSTSGANSGSSSSSRSQGGNATGNASTQTQNQGVRSTTNTGVTLNQTSNAPGTTQSTNNNTTRDIVSGGTSNNNNNSGFTSSDNTVRTTPTVYAPPVSGGNPCTLAVSGGVSVIGWGAAAGGTFVDQDCANRQKIAMVWNSGLKDIAFELMCNDRDTYNAAKSAPQGSPRCAFRQAFEPQGAQPPYAVQQPVPQPVPLGPAPTVQRTTTTQTPFQPSGRFACMDARGREVAAGTPGASCGYI